MGMLWYRHNRSKAGETPAKEVKVAEEEKTTQPKKRSTKKPAEGK